MVLMCVESIELVWDGKIWKNGRKHTFWAFSSDMYRYTLNMYRYMSDMYWYTLPYFDQVSYFSHNVLISYPI